MFETLTDTPPEQRDLTPTAPAQTQSPAPLDYTQLKWPEGTQSAARETFLGAAQEMKLPPEMAQKLVDWNTQQMARQEEVQEQTRQEMLQRWADKTKAVLGPQYEEHLAVAVRAARTYGGEELQTLLKETGLGNHPVIVKTFYAIGRATGEDASTGGPAAAQTDKTFAQALYGAN